MSTQTFTLPDVGEGLTEAEIVSWKVSVGDTVAINDVLCEIETAKSLVELPSPFAGKVTALLVEEGKTVEVGTPIISVGSGAADDGGAPPAEPATSVQDRAQNERSGTEVASSAETVAESEPGQGEENVGPLVGSGPKPDAVKRRPRRNTVASGAAPVSAPVVAAQSIPAQSVPAQSVPAPATRAVAAAPSAQTPPAPSSVAPSTAVPSAAEDEKSGLGGALTGLVNRVLAKPPVRKIARDLGIDLSLVTPTGARGEVTREDLVSYQAQREEEVAQAGTFWTPQAKSPERRIERIPVKGVRKATARAMVDSAFQAPHVSIFVDIDASRTMEFVQRLKKSRDFEGIKVSPLLILAKAVIWAAARNPSVNSEWVSGPDGDEIHVKHFMNLGIAAATPRGLLVPNIKDAQDLSLKELAVALNELATTARAGKTTPADMRGGTLTVTNVGALGIDTGTPIINPGEVAIVAFGTIKQKPWVVSGEVIPRWITTLGGSFDHRVVDGDLSARFMADVAAIMEEPALLLD
ncbi:dihydrolipoamide acetyltransferase family protein [Arthrobacter sp. NPDC090010]|uniref:dihydrolipoamide acetyltransferase family protein n=1 Tax=Arthrobacter sp. NPDC090010 TaxID=3363942 RepID=UPI00382BC94F